MTVTPTSFAEGGGPLTVSVTPAGASRAIRLVETLSRVVTPGATFSTVDVFDFTTIPAGVTSQSVPIARLSANRYPYELFTSYSMSGERYACEAEFSIDDSVPPAVNLRSSVSANGGSGISGTARITNTSANTISMLTERRIQYRKVGDTTFTTAYSGLGTYTANGFWTRNFSVSPATDGDYEVCVVADRSNALAETDEADNSACTIVTVDRSVTGTPGGPGGPGGTPTTPPTITVNPDKVRKGTTTEIAYNTGGNLNCVISGNSQTVPVAPTPRTGTIDSTPILGETTYTLVCDSVTPVTATVEVLPVYEEF